MKSRKAKITVIICIMLLLTGAFAVLRMGSSTVTETAEENSEKIQTISEDEISEYTTKTVIVKAKGDISSKGALEEKREGDLYIFTYKTEEDAKEAHEAFQNDENIEYADSNAVIAAMEAHEHEDVQAPEGFPEPDESVIKDMDKNIDVTKKDTVEGINRYIKESSNEIVVAVLDSGINTEDERVLPGINVTGETVMDDDTGHGTKIADIILSNTGKNVKVMPIKVLNNNRGTMLDLYRGIREAIGRDVDVINISVNGIKTKDSGMITEAIEEATNKGIVVVTSAGNDSIDAKYTTPANVESAITVSSVSSVYAFAKGYSNFGDVVDYSALGTYTTIENGKGEVKEGTSYSAAYVSSAVAGIKGMNPEYGTSDVEQVLDSYAIDLGNTGKDKLYGNGLISLNDIDFNKINTANKSTQDMEADYSLTELSQDMGILNYEDNWKELDTESLDEIVEKTNLKMLAIFLHGLSDEDFDAFIEKSNYINTIFEYEENKSAPLYKYAMMIYSDTELKAADTPFNKNSSTFQLQKNYGSVYEVKVTLNTNYTNSKEDRYTINSVAITGNSEIGLSDDGINLSDVKKGISDEGPIWSVLSLKFRLILGENEYISKKTNVPKCDCCRFNYQEYNYWNDAANTLPNESPQASGARTKYFKMQVNTCQAAFRNCKKCTEHYDSTRPKNALGRIMTGTYVAPAPDPPPVTWNIQCWAESTNGKGIEGSWIEWYDGTNWNLYPTTLGVGMDITLPTRIRGHVQLERGYKINFWNDDLNAYAGYLFSNEANAINPNTGLISEYTPDLVIDPKDANIVLRIGANVVPIQYTIDYDYNGGTAPSGGNLTTVYYDQEFTVNNPTRTGYKFLGWQMTGVVSATSLALNKNDNQWYYLYDNDGGNYFPDVYTKFKNMRDTAGTVTFKAMWEEINYDIEFNLNGAGATLDGQTNPVKKTVAYSTLTNINHPTREGYTFNGWDITGMTNTIHYYANGTSGQDESWNTFASATEMNKTYFRMLRSSSGTVTFKAQWTPKTHTLTIVPAGGRLYGYINGVNSYSTNLQTRTVTFDSPYHFVTTNYAVGDATGYFMIERTKEGNVYKPFKQGYDFTGWRITKTNSNTELTSQLTRKTLTDASGDTYYDYVYNSTYDGNATATAQWDPQILTINLDHQGGTSSTSKMYEKYGVMYSLNSTCPSGNGIQTITPPTKTGYIFDGYYMKTNGSGDQIIDKDGKIVTSNTYFYKAQNSTTTTFTIYAKWKEKKYTLKIDPNGGSLCGADENSTLNGQWSDKTRTRTVTGDISFLFGTTNDMYSLDKNSYMCMARTLEDDTYRPYKQGYDFDTWLVENDTNPSQSKRVLRRVSEDTTNENYNRYYYEFTYSSTYEGDNKLTAQWTPQKLTIYLDPDGGNNSTPRTLWELYGNGYYKQPTCGTSDKISKLMMKPSRIGYDFKGYYTEKNGGGDLIIDEDGNIVVSDTYFYKARNSANTEFTIYAKWEEQKYTLNINPNGGRLCGADPNSTLNGQWSKSSRTRTITRGTEYFFVTTTGVYSTDTNGYMCIESTLENNEYKPFKEGYDFTEWEILVGRTESQLISKENTSASPSYTDYVYKSTYTGDNHYLTAQWAAQKLTIYLDDRKLSTDLPGGTSSDPNPIYEEYKKGYYKNSSCTLGVSKITKPTRPGYTFKGYYYTKNGEEDQIINENGMIVASNTYFCKERNSTNTEFTIYAKWTPNQYTLTINPNGGQLCGHELGWSDAVRTRRVTFDSEFFFVTTSQTIGSNDNGYMCTSSTIENSEYKPYKQGYDFTGWYDASGTNQVNPIEKTPASPNPNYTDYVYKSTYPDNNTVTAQWTPQILRIDLYDQKPPYDNGWKDSSPKIIYELYGIGYYTSANCNATTSISKITPPERTGYTFGGYYYTKNGVQTQVIDADGNITSNRKIFYKEKNSTNTTFVVSAKWTPIKYGVVYINEKSTGKNDSNRTNTATKNNSKYNDSTNSKTFDTAFNLQNNKFTRFYDVSYDYNGGNTGISSNRATYTFRGWEDKNNYMYHGHEYKYKTEFNAPFYANTNTDVKNVYGYNKLALLQHYLSIGKSEGRVATGDNEGYPNGATVNNLTTENTEVSLYALWDDGSVTLPTPTRAKSADGYEYEFLGWFDVKYADDADNYDYDHLIGKAGDTIVPKQDMQLYANWHRVRPGIVHPVPYQGEPATKISISADWIDKDTDNRNTDYDIYKGKTIPDKDKVNVSGIAKVTVTATITNGVYSAKDWGGNSVSFTAKAVTNKIIETIDTTKWKFVSFDEDNKINGSIARYVDGRMVWKPDDNTTGTIKLIYYVQLKEDYWDIAEKTLYDIESKDTIWTYNIGGDSINILYGEPRTNIHSPVNVQMRPVDWNPNDTGTQPTPTPTPKPGATPGPDLPSDPDPTPAPDNGGFVSRISIRSDNSNTQGSAWNFYKKKNEVNTYYVKYNTKASEPKSQFKLAFYGVLKRARVGYQINNMYFDSHYSKDGKAQTYDYFTDNLEKIGQKYAWSSSVLTHADWYYAEDGTPHVGTKSKVLDFVNVSNTRSNDTSGIAVNASDPRTKLSSEQTNTVTNGDNGARIDVYPQVKINGDNTYYNENKYVLSDTDVISKRISLVVDAKDPVLTYKPKDETNFYDEDTDNGEDIGEGNYIDINLTDSYKTEGTKELVFNFGDDVSGISDPDRYPDDWITNSNQNVQVRLERLGYKEDGTIVTNEEYKAMSSTEKAKVSNDPIVIYDNKNNVTNNTVEISYNSDGTGGSFKVNLDKDDDNILGHLRMTVKITDNVGNYYDKVYDFYVLKLTGKVEISKYLPRYSEAAANNTLNEFKKGESGNVSISAKGYVDRITTDFGTNMVKWTEEEAKLHNIFASDNYHINGDYPRDYDSSKPTLPAKYHKLAWGYINSELGGLPVKLSSQYTKKITVTKDIVNNNIDVLKAGNVVTVPAKYESGSLVQDSYTIAFSTEKNSADLPKYIVVNGKDKAKLTWKDDKVSFDEIVTTSTDWVTVNGEKLRPMVHAFYIPFSADTGDYTVLVTAYKDGHKVRINIPYKVDGNILSDIRTRIRDN